MNWIAFAIVVFLTAMLQAAAAPFLAVHGIRPELPTLVAAYYALMARRGDALLACWIIGLVVDLNSLSYQNGANVGAAALSYGLAALAVVHLRELAFRDHVLTYVGITAGWTILCALFMGLHAAWVQANRARAAESLIAAAYTAAYGAVIAPYVLWVLRRLRSRLGLGEARTYRVRT